MIVIIFVAQNNFETVQEFPTVSLDFTLAGYYHWQELPLV